MGELVDDALAGGLPPRPELEVLRSIVEPIPISVMDGLVRPQRPTEQLRHDQPMFVGRGRALCEVPELRRDRNTSVSVVNESGAADLADWFVGLDVAVFALAAPMCRAQAASCRCVATVRHRALFVDLRIERTIGVDAAVADQAEVVAVAEAAFRCDAVAAVGHAGSRRGALADGDAVADTAGAEPTAVVRLTQTARIHRPIALRHLAHRRAPPTAILAVEYDEKCWCATLVWMADIRRYAQLADRLREHSHAVRLVGIDGCGGAGKSTFAERLARHGDNWPIVHTDDFASHDEPLEWWPRLLADVIEPMSQRRPATFRAYDWVNRRPGVVTTIEPADVVVIEGVGATRKAWRERLAMGIWVDTDSALRLRRGLARDGEALAEFWREWRVAEDRYVADEDPASGADLVVAGDPDGVAHDPEEEFVVVSERQRAAGHAG